MHRIHRSPSRLATHSFIGALLVIFGTNLVRAQDTENRLESPSLSAGNLDPDNTMKIAAYDDLIGNLGRDPARERTEKTLKDLNTKARDGNFLDKTMNWLLSPAVKAAGGVQVGNQEWRRGNTGAAMRSYGGAAANTVAFLLIIAAPVLLIMSIFLPSRRRAGRRREGLK